MKPYYLLFLFLVFGLIFVVSKKDPGAPQIQAEEARPDFEKISANTYRIRMEIKEKNDRPVADILWFQKAAEVAMEKNIPWFNVLEQKISPYEVEGVIQLSKDPMEAEYDANEILSLQLTEENPKNR